MSIETIVIEQPKTDWRPGYGEISVYDGAISTGPQYLTLDDRKEVIMKRKPQRQNGAYISGRELLIAIAVSLLITAGLITLLARLAQ